MLKRNHNCGFLADVTMRFIIALLFVSLVERSVQHSTSPQGLFVIFLQNTFVESEFVRNSFLFVAIKCFRSMSMCFALSAECSRRHQVSLKRVVWGEKHLVFTAVVTKIDTLSEIKKKTQQHVKTKKIPSLCQT